MSHDDQQSDAPGWDAIDEALRPIYGTQEPKHWGTIMPYAFGGPDPIQGISAYQSERGRHHLHYVTYGFSDLYEKESDDPDQSGFGFELTFRLALEPDDEPPHWALNFLQNLGRYVFETGNCFGAGDTMSLNGPIQQGADTAIRAIGFTLDPELGKIITPHGTVEFLQIVGLTEDEREAARLWNAESFLELARQNNSLLLTDLSRESLLKEDAFRQEVEQRSKAEGSSTGALYTSRLLVECEPRRCRLVLGALAARDLSRWLLARIPHGRDFFVESESVVLSFQPGPDLSWRAEDLFYMTLNPDQCQRLSQLLALGAGIHTDPKLPGLTVEIERTEIKDNEGRVVDVIE